jgi:hypothetical protein
MKRTVAWLGILLIGIAVGFSLRRVDAPRPATGVSYAGAVASIRQGLLPGQARFVGEMPGWSRYTYTYAWRGGRGCTIEIVQNIESLDQNRQKPLDVRTETVFALDLSRQDPDLLASNVGENPAFVSFDEDVVVSSREYTRTSESTRSAEREGPRYLAIYAQHAAAARSLAQAFEGFTRTCQGHHDGAGDGVNASPPGTFADTLLEDTAGVAEQLMSPPEALAVPAPTAPPGFTLRAVNNDPDGYTNVRAGQSTSSAVLAQVVDGEVFETYRQDGDWWQVRTNGGTIGYMHISRIRLLE